MSFPAYSEYRDSGVEWLGKIPEHWLAVRLKHQARQIIDGAHFTPTYTDHGVPFLRVTDIQNPEINRKWNPKVRGGLLL